MPMVPQRHRQTDGRTTYDSNTALALRASRGKNRNRNLIDWRYWNKSLFWRKFINLVWLIAVSAVDVAACVRVCHCAAAVSLRRHCLCTRMR